MKSKTIHNLVGFLLMTILLAERNNISRIFEMNDLMIKRLVLNKFEMKIDQSKSNDDFNTDWPTNKAIFACTKSFLGAKKHLEFAW